MYLITKYDVAQKYAKGGRKLYQITIAKGKSSDEVAIPLANIQQFVNQYVLTAKRKDVLGRMQQYARDGSNVNSQIFINILINEDAIKSANMPQLREFLIQHGVDYQIVRHPFGWGDSTMVVLFKMDKIVQAKVVTPQEKITQFDLPSDFAS